MLQGDIFVQTRYHAPWNPIHNTTKCLCICHTSCTVCTFYEPFSGLLLEYRHFQHSNNLFLCLEMHSISPDMSNYQQFSSRKLTANQQLWFQCETSSSEHATVVRTQLCCGKLLLCLSLHSLSCANPIYQEKRFASTSDQPRMACVINSVVDERFWPHV